jgi:hypothetical protein
MASDLRFDGHKFYLYVSTIKFFTLDILPKAGGCSLQIHRSKKESENEQNKRPTSLGVSASYAHGGK